MMPGWPELFIVLLIVLVFFGAGKLPQVFEAMGDGLRRFRDAQAGRDEDDEPKQIASTTARVSDAAEVGSKTPAAE